jgi:hypothetical protein
MPFAYIFCRYLPAGCQAAARGLFCLAVVVTVMLSELSHASAAVAYDPEPDVAQAARFIENLASKPPEPGALPMSHDRLPRFSVYGDSTAAALNVGLQFWLDQRNTGRARTGLAELGCGLLREGTYRFRGGAHMRPEHCQKRTSAWRDSLRRDQPDMALVLFGTWEVCDRKLPGEDAWRQLGDPVLDDQLRREMLDVVDLLSENGTLVVWLTHPTIEVRELAGGNAPATPYPESDPARMARFNELVLELPEARPGKVRILDLAAYLRTLPGGDLDPDYRPDGIHYSAEGTLRLAHDWLEAEVNRLYREARIDNASADSSIGEPVARKGPLPPRLP